MSGWDVKKSQESCTVPVSVPPVNMTSKTREREIDGLAPTSLFSQHISFKWHLSHLENFVGPIRHVRISDLSRLLDDAKSLRVLPPPVGLLFFQLPGVSPRIKAAVFCQGDSLCDTESHGFDSRIFFDRSHSFFDCHRQGSLHYFFLGITSLCSVAATSSTACSKSLFSSTHVLCCRPRAHFSLQWREYFEHFSRGIFQCACQQQLVCLWENSRISLQRVRHVRHALLEEHSSPVLEPPAWHSLST